MGRRSQPPADFVAGDAAIDYARKHGLDLEDEQDGWLDWCAANGKLYLDHQAAFRTWLRRAREFGRGKPPPTLDFDGPSPVSARESLSVYAWAPYACPRGLGCDNGWVRDTEPLRRCPCSGGLTAVG